MISLIVGRGAIRAESFGFLLPIVLYSLVVLLSEGASLSRYGGVLPHTQFIQTRINRDEWLLRRTDADQYEVQETIQNNTRSKILLGHLLVAVVAGYVGSRYAGFIYARSRNTPD